MVRGNDLKILNFQVFGERNSGTNFVSHLVQANLNLPERAYGWKHGFPVAIGYNPASLIIVIYRHPLSWLVSLFNKPRTTDGQVSKDFSEFIRTPFTGFTNHNSLSLWRELNCTVPNDLPRQTLQGDLHPLSGRPFENPMQLRNAKLLSHLSFKRRVPNAVFAQYEGINANPDAFIDSLRVQFQLNAGTFSGIDDQVQPARAFSGRTPINASDVSADDMKFIRSQLDQEQERSIGYNF